MLKEKPSEVIKYLNIVPESKVFDFVVKIKDKTYESYYTINEHPLSEEKINLYYIKKNNTFDGDRIETITINEKVSNFNISQDKNKIIFKHKKQDLEIIFNPIDKKKLVF